MHTRLLVLSAVLITTAAAPEAARAATLVNPGSTIALFADAGEANRLTVTLTSTSVTFTDTAATITDAAGCSGSGHTVVCGNFPILVGLGDLDDEMTVTGQGSGDNTELSVNPGPGDDLVTGGAENDTIVHTAGDGADTLIGGGGLNLVDYRNNGPAGPIQAVLPTSTGNGEAGENDTFNGINGIKDTPFDDVITGGPEADTIVLSQGADTVTSGGGDDQITAIGAASDVGPNTIDAGDGDDHVQWNSIAGETIGGGAGDDTLTPTSDGVGRAVVSGDAGDDAITGASSGDTLLGGDGGDAIVGSAGADLIDGGAGSDHLEGSAGADSITGGSGVDTIAAGSGADIVAVTDGEQDEVGCGTGADQIDGDPIDSVSIDCELLTGGALSRTPFGQVGAPGPAGPITPGPAGPAATLPVPAFVAVGVGSRLDGRPGRRVKFRYVTTIRSAVTLVVKKRLTRIATIAGTARPGLNSISWNGRSGRNRAAKGAYSVTLTLVSADGRTKTVRSSVTLR